MSKIILITGPSSVGKSTLINGLMALLPNIREMKSYTTRDMGTGESYGRPYYFVKDHKFSEMILHNEFAEWSPHYSYRYGTSKKELDTYLNSSLEIGIKAMNVGKVVELKKDLGDQLVAIFLKPPSLEDLKYRILRRGRGEDLSLINGRLSEYESELSLQSLCDLAVVAETPEQTLFEVKEFVSSIIR